MNIKIEIKDTATLSRIESLCKALQMLKMHLAHENIDMEIVYEEKEIER